MSTLIIITGASGSGKTLQLTLLEGHYGQGRVQTITTRPKRAGGAGDAYKFVTEEQLADMEDHGETIWVTSRHGSRYSITKQAVYERLRENFGLAFVVITPDYHVTLTNWCKRENITPVHIHLVAPSPDEQKHRLQARDGDEFDPERIEATAEFETAAEEAKGVLELTGTELHFTKQASPVKMFSQLCQIIDLIYVPS